MRAVVAAAVLALVVGSLCGGCDKGNAGREKAEQTSCLRSMKQISLGVIQYCSDYDRRFPLGYPTRTDWTVGGIPVWGVALEPYIQNERLYVCPTAYSTGNDITNYVMSTGTLLDSDPTTGILPTIMPDHPGRPEIDFKNASYSIMLYERHHLQYPFDHGTEYTQSETSGKPPEPLHTDGGNYAFVDGHAKWMKGGTAPSRQFTHGWDP